MFINYLENPPLYRLPVGELSWVVKSNGKCNQKQRAACRKLTAVIKNSASPTHNSAGQSQ